MSGYWTIHEDGLTECREHRFTWDQEDTEAECHECGFEAHLEDIHEGRVYG